MRPTETKTGNDTTRLDHPAMGVVVLSRPSGAARMFGSSIEHRHYIEVEINRAHLDRRFNRDQVVSGDTIVKFALSASQWSQMVSGVGIGSGTPVTLTRAPAPGTPLESIPSFEREPINDTFAREMREAAANASQEIRRVEAMLDAYLQPGAKGPGKAAIQELRSALRDAGTYFESNMGFVQKQFTQTMEETTEAAKIEVETFISGVAMRTGLESLRADTGSLALGCDPLEKE